MSTWQCKRRPFSWFHKKVIVWEGFFYIYYLLFIVWEGEKQWEKVKETGIAVRWTARVALWGNAIMPGSREKSTCGGELLLAPAELHCNNVWRCDWASDAHLEACSCTILITITMTIVIITNIIIIVTIITSHHHHQPSCLHALTHHTGS